MAYLADFVCETASNPGTSTTVSLLGAAAGLPVRTFAAGGFTTGSRIYYTISDGASQSETGIGTFTIGTPNTISRDTVKANTAGSAARLNFTGTVYVYSFVPASQSVLLDENQKCNLPGALAVVGLADLSVGGVKIAAAGQASNTAPLRADQAWQEVTKYQMAAVNNRVIPLPTAFSRFRITGQTIVVSTNGASLVLDFSSDGGTTFNQGANYHWAGTQTTENGVSANLGASNAIGLSCSVGLSSTWPYDFTLELWPGSGSRPAGIRGSGFGVPAVAGLWGSIVFAGTLQTPLALVNACRFYPSSGGNMTGTIIVEGLP